MPAEPIGENNPIEAILLTAFPNPERVGCPPADVLKAMANQEVARDNPAWSHIWRCSPCFRDFKVHRDARVARVEREFERKRSRRQFLTTAALVLASSGAAYVAAIEFRARSRQAVAVVVDLTAAGVTRGGDHQQPLVARLPRQLDELHLTLPRFSPAGGYVVAILESRMENTAIALGSAPARAVGEQIVLVVTLDLSQVRPGQYLLGTRRDTNGHQEAPSYYPVLISD
ncbi:MAG: hypothetical protein ACJ746_00805 [Bryobacteraceae bacterium]